MTLMTRRWLHEWWVTLRYGSRFTKAGRTLRRNLRDPLSEYVEVEDWVVDLPHEAPGLVAMAEARIWHLPLSERAARVRGLERDQSADACDKGEQELREGIARQIEGMADHLGMHGLGSWPIGERAGLHMAARIARDLDHFRMVCPDCTSQVGGITPALAEQYADEHRAKGHTPRIEDERP